MWVIGERNRGYSKKHYDSQEELISEYFRGIAIEKITPERCRHFLQKLDHHFILPVCTFDDNQKDFQSLADELFFYIFRSGDLFKRSPEETVKIATNVFLSGQWITPHRYHDIDYKAKLGMEFKPRFAQIEPIEFSINDKVFAEQKIQSLRSLLI